MQPIVQKKVKKKRINKTKILYHTKRFETAQDFVDKVVKPYKKKTPSLQKEGKNQRVLLDYYRGRMREELTKEEKETVRGRIVELQERVNKIERTMRRRVDITNRIEDWAFEKKMMEKPIEEVLELRDKRMNDLYFLLKDVGAMDPKPLTSPKFEKLTAQQKKEMERNKLLLRKLHTAEREYGILERIVLKKQKKELSEIKPKNQ